jgi:phospholipid/cholesterol/gamma-HCH transport system substrate-binding protein
MRLTKGNPYVAAVVLVTVVLAVITAAVGINLSSGLPFNLSLSWPPRQDYTLSAAFSDANGVYPGADVVVAGAQVGQVTGIRIEHDQAVVTMRISRQYEPLHRGTVASIRYTTLLANKYIELTPAAGTALLPSGATIPSDQTVTPVDFDQFLSSLDAKTRQQLQVLVQQLGGGVTGDQAAINALLSNLSGLSEQSPPVLNVLQSRDPQLASIISNLDTVAATLAQSHQQLGQLVQNTALVTETLARNDARLDDLLVHLASVSQDTSRTLQGNQANLRTTIERLDPLLGQLNPQLTTTAGYFDQASPTLQSEIKYLIPEVVSAISQQDANGNYLRQFVVVNTCYDTLASAPASSKKANPTGGCLVPLITGLVGPASGRPAPRHSASGHPARGKSRPAPGKATKPGAHCPSLTPLPSPSLKLPLPSPSLPLPSLPSTACPKPPPGCTVPARTPAPRPTPSPTCHGTGSGSGGLIPSSVPSLLPSPVPNPLGPVGNVLGG